MKKNGYSIKEIRSREISRNPDYDFKDSKYFIDKYEAGNGINYFIECASPDRKANFGFIRLRITNSSFFDELKDKGLIRELHVYNYVKSFSNNSTSLSTQHLGIGKTLIKKAEEISKKHSKKGMAVISGVGVEDYYLKQGYYEGDYYLLKDFEMSNILKNILYFIVFYVLLILLIGYFLD